MANLQITQHAMATGGHLTSLGILGSQATDRADLVIGTVQNTAAFSAYTVVRLYPEAKCVIRIGVNAVAVAGTGETLAPDTEYVRYVKEGERISVVAAA